MWVCRAGKDAQFLDYYVEASKIFLPWDGFRLDLSLVASLADYRSIVSTEMETDNCTSISNWAGQLNAFVNEIQTGDYVLVPYKNSRFFALVQVIGAYEYNESNEKNLYHAHKVNVLDVDIPKDIFSQSIQYGLRAYKTVYRVKNEDMILTKKKKWKQEGKQN